MGSKLKIITSSNFISFTSRSDLHRIFYISGSVLHRIGYVSTSGICHIRDLPHQDPDCIGSEFFPYPYYLGSEFSSIRILSNSITSVRRTSYSTHMTPIRSPHNSELNYFLSSPLRVWLVQSYTEPPTSRNALRKHYLLTIEIANSSIRFISNPESVNNHGPPIPS